MHFIYQTLSVAFSIFIVMDALGNLPIFITQLKNVPIKNQKKVVIREHLIALVIIILFYFVGRGILDFLKISTYSLQIAGGIILFILSLTMLFSTKEETFSKSKEPFIVPLAVPLIAGPAVLTTIILFSNSYSMYIMLSSITVAWFLSLIILISSSFISKILKNKGILALERLMGFILIMIATQMFLAGIASFIKLKL
jgi:MarC family membrane protein